MAGRANGVFPNSLRAASNLLKVVSSGASTVASSVRSSVASAVLDSKLCTEQENKVHWAGFDRLQSNDGKDCLVLLLGYRSGFQVWDVEDANDFHELVSRHDAAVSFMRAQPKPSMSQESVRRFDAHPLLIIAGDSAYKGENLNLLSEAIKKGMVNDVPYSEREEFMPTVVLFYSLKSHSYIHFLKFNLPVYSIKCNSRVVAISQVSQIHCLNAASLEKEFTLLTHPIMSRVGVGYGPLALGPRWLAYSGDPVTVCNNGPVVPQKINHDYPSSTTSNGSLVAHYAKQSSKQLAAGIVSIGDMGYKKLSKYCSELLYDCDISQHLHSTSQKENYTISEHSNGRNIGMVIVKDIVSRGVITQFKAHSFPISALCFDPSGMLLATASVQGHSINVFLIQPSLLGRRSENGYTGSYVHLYRLQRGFTNAVFFLTAVVTVVPSIGFAIRKDDLTSFAGLRTSNLA